MTDRPPPTGPDQPSDPGEPGPDQPSEPGEPGQAAQPSEVAGWLATGYVALVGVVAIVVAVAGQIVIWLREQAAVAEQTPPPNSLVTCLVSAVIVLIVLVPVAWFPMRWPVLRAAGLAWGVAAVLLAVLGALRELPQPQNELYLAVLAALTGALALAARLYRRPAPGERAAPSVVWLGGAGGAVVLLPWLWTGALGGRLETLLAMAAAAGFGTLTGTLLGRRFWWPYRNLARWRLVLGGGFVAGVTLTLLAAGLGGSGVQLTALLGLPTLGFAAAALQRGSTVSGVPVGVLAGVAAFGPLGFVDPEEVSLLLVNFWPLLAGLVALAGGVALSLGYGFGWRKAFPRPGVAALLTVVTTLAGIGVYAAAGRPGFYGERLFVVLSSQASLPTAAPGTPRTERIAAVYRHLVRHAERTQQPLRRELDRFGVDYTPYYLVNGISVDAGPVVREWLSRQPGVDRVLLDPVLRPIPAETPAIPAAEQPAPGTPGWNLTMVGAPRTWAQFGATGRGIVVGSSDSGVDGRHPALRDQFRGGDDSWYDPWNHTRTPVDHNGHGTHTTGTAVGSHDVGVAPGAEWIGCVNLARNSASPSRYLDCLQFMLAPFADGEDPFRDGDPARAPHVLNNSWGCPGIEGCDAGSLRPAVDAFRAAGIFFVTSAGNTGPRCGSLTDPPARYPDAFTVGAVDSRGRVADFSSRGRPGSGPQPDVAAPGADVVSAFPGGGYAPLSGTSMAGPHVAGAVALLWSAVPSLSGDIERTERLLRDTARPVTGAVDCGAQATVGAGILDVYAAVQAARRTAR